METKKTNLRKWQIRLLREVLEHTQSASILYGDTWKKEDFKIWVETWIIPEIKEVLNEN